MQRLIQILVMYKNKDMKKLILSGIGICAILLTSCKDETPKKDDCIHCSGCFSSWDECESDYRPDTLTWEQHRDYMVNNPSGATWQCERTN
jgi:hypothetical protein